MKRSMRMGARGIATARVTCYTKNMIAERIPDIATLSGSDRLILAKELFDGAIDEEEEDAELSPEIIKLLQDRMDHYEKHPETAVRWEDLRGSWRIG